MPTWYNKAQADTLLAGKDAAGAAAAAQAAAATDATTKAANAQTAATTAAATDATTKANSAQAFAVQRANHTGTQSADTLTDGTTNKAFLATERTKLTGIATGATANSPDATLLARANHTGTQAASTVTGLATVATTGVYSDLTGRPDVRAPYLGPVATRGRIPSGVVASSIYKQMMTWSRHIATDDIPAAALVYSTINGVGEVAVSCGPGTVTASIEYPMGTYNQITFSASTTGTLPANDHLVSDTVTLSTKIPAGATFWVGTWVGWTGTNSAVMMDALYTSLPAANTRENVQASTTTVTDATMTGTRSSGGTNPRDSYRPTAILGMTRQPTFLLTGDSRTRAGLAWEQNQDAFGYQGLTEQVLGGRFGYINVGVGTDSYTNVLSATGNNYVKRGALGAYCTHILDDYGINSVWADTSATHQANVTSFRAKFAGKVYYKTTLVPQLTTASTQTTTTGSDQTPNSTLSLLVTNNNWVRQGGAGALDGFIELEDVVTMKRDSGIFLPPERIVTDGAMTSGSNVLTSATAAFTTSDVGKHVHILGAGAAAAPLKGYIGAVTNATTVTILTPSQTSAVMNAGTTVSAATVGIGVLSPDGTHQSKRLETLIRNSAAWRALAMIR